MQSVYSQLQNKESMLIGIILQICFLTIINIIVSKEKCTSEENKIIDVSTEDFKYKKILIHTLQIGLVLILCYHLFFNITTATTILEYSILLFIFALYFSKDDKKNRIVTEILLVIFAIYSLKNGDRIAVLQIILADFIINYIDKIKIKQIIILMIIGIIVFTLFGLYGDFLVYGHDFKDLTLKYTVDTIKERRFALDTSVSSYFTGVSMIDVSENYTIGSRVKNGIEFFTKYTFIGSKSNYEQLSYKIRTYQINYGGGFITCYFYFWFSWIGVIFISTYVGVLIKKVIVHDTSLYKSLLSIFIISTVPRWYLYEPLLLFRGVILFSIFYLIISKIFIKNENIIDKIKENKHS